MQKHIRVICALATFQILCLGFGLWIHDRILIHAANWTNRQITRNHKAEKFIPANDISVVPQAMSFAAIEQSMPMVRVLTLVWIGGLQFIAMFLVISRVGTDNSKTEAQSRIELLRREKDLVALETP